MTQENPIPRSWKARLGRALPVLALAALGLLALGETVAVHFQAGPPAKDVSWQAAATFLHNHFQNGDLLLFRPAWIDPVGRKHMGDLLTLDQVSRPDEDTYHRVWVVGLAGRQANLSPRRHPHRQLHRRFGNIEVRLFEQDPVQVVYDFYEEVASADVELLTKGNRVVQRCPWSPSRKRHQCRAGWNNVRQKLAEIDYRLRRCIYAHPHEQYRLRITFPQASLGEKLVVYTGLDNYASRYKARKAVLDAKKKNPESPKARPVDVTMKVWSQDRLLGTIQQPVDEAWHRHELKTSPANQVMVRYEISTKNAYGKVFCFYARAER